MSEHCVDKRETPLRQSRFSVETAFFSADENCLLSIPCAEFPIDNKNKKNWKRGRGTVEQHFFGQETGRPVHSKKTAADSIKDNQHFEPKNRDGVLYCYKKEATDFQEVQENSLFPERETISFPFLIC